MAPALRLDPAGNVVVQPVTDWGIASSEANRVVFLALEFMEHPGQLETGERGQLQGTLSPQQALEIAASLITAATRLLEPPLAEKSRVQ